MNGGGISTAGGSFTSTGAAFTIIAIGLRTDGGAGLGNVRLTHTGLVNITNGGVTTGGGSFIASGNGFVIQQLVTNGGAVLLTNPGALNILNAGVDTGGGSFTTTPVSSADITNGGLRTAGGAVSITSLSTINVDQNGVSSASAAGGNIVLRAATAITVPGTISSAGGSGGVLLVVGNVTLSGPPVTLGQGNVSLIVGPIIAGNAGAPGVTLTWLDGTTRTTVSDANGDYSLNVPAGWSGTVTPSLPGRTFTPTSRSYTALATNQLGQNYSLVPLPVPALDDSALGLLASLVGFLGLAFARRRGR